MNDQQTQTDTAQTGASHWTTQEFDTQLQQAGEKPVFVDFFAEWCGPCKIAEPVVNKLAKEYSEKAVIAKVDVDEERDLAMKYGVQSIPTVLVFKKGEVVDRKVGYPGEPVYRQMLDKAVAA